MSQALDHMAERVDAMPFFLGHWLRRWVDESDLGWSGLCDRIGLPPGELTALRLCRAPEPATRDRDIAELSARYGCDQIKLSDVLREAGI